MGDNHPKPEKNATMVTSGVTHNTNAKGDGHHHHHHHKSDHHKPEPRHKAGTHEHKKHHSSDKKPVHRHHTPTKTQHKERTHHKKKGPVSVKKYDKVFNGKDSKHKKT